MEIYLGLITFVIVMSILVKAGARDFRRQETVILFLGLLAVFLLLALKKDTVGVDTLGYHEQYLLSAEKHWLDFDYVYFEGGYILLMKLFSKFGLSFRIFTASIYALLCTAYYRFLRRFSENVTLSLLVVICYQFLVFHISGLRQTLAMVVCLYAFLALDRGRLFPSLLLAALSVTFHRGALAFFAVYPIWALKGRRLPGLAYFLAAAAAVLLRPLFWALVGCLFPDVAPAAGMELGGNCLFLGGMALFLLYTRAACPEIRDGFFSHMALTALMADLVLSGSTLLRCNMFFTLFLIPGIPNAIRRYEPRTRLIGNLSMGGFLILLFYTQTLAINQLGLLPYRFFWQ